MQLKDVLEEGRAQLLPWIEETQGGIWIAAKGAIDYHRRSTM